MAVVAGRVVPALEAAAKDPEPARRAAAARALALSDDPGQRRSACLLLDDAVGAVRLHAARVLVAKGERQAVATLIRLLTDATPAVAWEAEEMLNRLAGPSAPPFHLDLTNDSARIQCQASWDEWWKTRGSEVDFAQVAAESRPLGLTLITDLDKGRVVEIGRDHKERWRVDGFGGPVDVQLLPTGRILVAENHARKVTERDRSGKIVWEKSTPAFPASCQRLPNGNTFIATYNQLLEYAPDGREVLKVARADGVYSARRVRSGRMVLINSAGKVVTLDSSGLELSSFETGGIASWSSFEIQPNGHCLACCQANKVVEFDATGRRVWECAIPNAVCAKRLANGHTLICSSEGRRVVEVDRAGKVVWEHRTEGRPWHVVRR
jgi:hypothetical protein